MGSAPEAGTSRHLERTRLITVEAVKSAIRRIPGFGKHPAALDQRR
jgi:hypothetical protein